MKLHIWKPYDDPSCIYIHIKYVSFPLQCRSCSANKEHKQHWNFTIYHTALGVRKSQNRIIGKTLHSTKTMHYLNNIERFFLLWTAHRDWLLNPSTKCRPSLVHVSLISEKGTNSFMQSSKRSPKNTCVFIRLPLATCFKLWASCGRCWTTWVPRVKNPISLSCSTSLWHVLSINFVAITTIAIQTLFNHILHFWTAHGYEIKNRHKYKRAS